MAPGRPRFWITCKHLYLCRVETTDLLYSCRKLTTVRKRIYFYPIHFARFPKFLLIRKPARTLTEVNAMINPVQAVLLKETQLKYIYKNNRIRGLRAQWIWFLNRSPHALTTFTTFIAPQPIIINEFWDTFYNNPVYFILLTMLWIYKSVC
jgi:hypothetical protein